MEHGPPATEWNDAMQEHWEEFWVRVLLHTPEDPFFYCEAPALSQAMMAEYVDLIMRTCPHAGRQEDWLNPDPRQLYAQLVNSRWIMRMLVKTIPPAHAEIARGCYGDGADERLADGTMRLVQFVELVNKNAARVNQSERLFFWRAQDGSELHLEIHLEGSEVHRCS